MQMLPCTYCNHRRGRQQSRFRLVSSKKMSSLLRCKLLSCSSTRALTHTSTPQFINSCSHSHKHSTVFINPCSHQHYYIKIRKQQMLMAALILVVFPATFKWQAAVQMFLSGLAWHTGLRLEQRRLVLTSVPTLYTHTHTHTHTTRARKNTYLHKHTNHACAGWWLWMGGR